MLFNACFPDGVMENILVRLPVKSLIRFKAVRKSWRDSLSSPRFVQMQVDHAKKSKKLLVYSMNIRTFIPEIKILEERNNTFISNRVFSPCQLSRYDMLVIEDSCNGLVSFRFCSFVESCSIYLWNPATRECKHVKLPYNDVIRTCVGIAFVAKTNDYKMVRVSDSKASASVWVYSVNSDSWKELKHDFKYSNLVSGQAVTLQGCMHWVTDVGGSHIVGFDMENEVLRNLPLPNIDNHVSIGRLLGVIRGSLSLLMTYKSGFLVDELWQMSDYGVGSCWRKVACIKPFPKISMPMEFCNDGINFCNFNNIYDEDVFSYDPFTQVTKNFRLSGFVDTQMVDYTETLASLGCGRNKSYPPSPQESYMF